MPGLLKTIEQIFFEYFFICYGLGIADPQLTELINCSHFYPLLNTIEMYLADLDEDTFANIASDLINFSNDEAESLVISISVRYSAQEIKIDLSDDYQSVLNECSKKYWCRSD